MKFKIGDLIYYKRNPRLIYYVVDIKPKKCKLLCLDSTRQFDIGTIVYEPFFSFHALYWEVVLHEN
jgi:hypothetical protein